MEDNRRRDAAAEADAETLARKVAGLVEAGRRLVSTRASLFGEELEVKAGFLGKGCAGISLAAAFVFLALLLFTAFIAALFTTLLGGPVAGIAAAFGLHVLIAAIVGYVGVRQMSRVKPFEFPVTSEEVRKDVAAIKAAACPEPPPAPPSERQVVPSAPSAPPPAAPRASTPAADDFEARFRAGSE
ncbi:MAG TPA: phage holin family protein [Thermoanaerobaculia bacterium]|nr:phage holin family protein [Thermoanaerobaculia bacterium]